MIPKPFTVTVLLAALGSAVLAAPQTPTKPKPNANQPAQVASQEGVNISPITRNHATSKVAFQLAKDGRALAPIVISDKAGKETKLAAEELKKYLDRISGASFEIQTGDGQSGLVLGNMQEFPVPALNKALEIRHGFEGKEAYAIRTREKRVLLLGATDKAASHAAYRLLEELGCRWFFQNATDDWEVIPSTPDLKFNLDITDRPQFLSRSIWYGYGQMGDNGERGHPRDTPEKMRYAAEDYRDWSRRNAMDQSFTVYAGHAYQNIIAQNKAEFEAHPEYYALTGGKRSGPQIELGNPKVRAMVLEYARRWFKENPNLDMVSVDPSDGGGYSESPEAREYSPDPSDAPFKMANEVAQMLHREFPGKLVGLLAYNWHSDPPPFPLEPNVYVQLTTAFNHGKLPFDELLKHWPERARNLGFYDYYSVWDWDADMWPGGRAGDKNYLIDRIRQFRDVNRQSGAFATSISAESSSNWGPHGRGYYLANKLMWNPDRDPDAILEDFYQKAFGPAASAMKEYYALQDSQRAAATTEIAPPTSTQQKLGQVLRALQKARAAAKGDSAVMKRLNDLAIHMRYSDLYLRSSSDGTNAEKWKTAYREVAYRSRYRYMMHWRGLLLAGLRDWSVGTDPKIERPWKNDAPITAEEIESWFQDSLKQYPEVVVPPKTYFASELVPVNVGGPRKTFASTGYQEGGAGTPILLYSDGKTPLRLQFKVAPLYGGAGPGWTLRDVKGKTIAQGKTKFDVTVREGVLDEWNVGVKPRGVYELVMQDAKNVYYFIAPPEQIVAFDMRQGQRQNEIWGTTPDLYFYVPKGTEKIEYYSTTPWPYLIINPENAVQAEPEINGAGAYISIPVPEGMDGKAWRIRPRYDSRLLGYYYFFNVPNLLSTSSAGMLLPKDVAQNDRLQIIK